MSKKRSNHGRPPSDLPTTGGTYVRENPRAAFKRLADEPAESAESSEAPQAPTPKADKAAK